MVTLKSNNLPYYLSVLGKTLVLWASPDCPSCQRILKKIDENKLREEGIQFLYINGDKWDSLCDEWEIEYYPTFMYFNENMDLVKREQTDRLNLIYKLWK